MFHEFLFNVSTNFFGEIFFDFFYLGCRIFDWNHNLQKTMPLQLFILTRIREKGFVVSVFELIIMQVFLLWLILIWFNFVSGLCCNRVRGSYYQNEKTDVYYKQSKRFGYYHKQLAEINGKPYYLSTDGNEDSALWFTGIGWAVGSMEQWLDEIADSSLFTLDKADCPEDTLYSWQYDSLPTATYPDYLPAGKGFTIDCADAYN